MPAFSGSSKASLAWSNTLTNVPLLASGSTLSTTDERGLAAGRSYTFAVARRMSTRLSSISTSSCTVMRIRMLGVLFADSVLAESGRFTSTQLPW